MLALVLRNLTRRPIRLLLTLFGLASSVALLAWLSAFGAGYTRALSSDLDRMGVQVMLVPLGCPYDAAARVLKGQGLENSLPESAWEEARRDPGVAVAAPMLLTAVSRPGESRTDMWAGIDRTALLLKPWWISKAGATWFQKTNGVILGAEAAEVEMRVPGDKLFSPETGQTFEAEGILKRSGTSDDSLFFVPLEMAQRMFKAQGRLTAIALRLHDPSLISEVTERLQRIPGTQAVTLTEMMGAFLNLLGSVRVLLRAIAMIAITVSALGVFNTLMAAIVERSREYAVMRAVGASRLQIFSMTTLEAALLAMMAGLIGILCAVSTGHWVEQMVKKFVPLAPAESLYFSAGSTVWKPLALAIGVGFLAGCYPAWRASQIEPARALKED